jgi:N-acetylmuramoyl-L-alanine amidase
MIVTDTFLTSNPYSRPGTPLGEVMALIMHWTGKPMQPAQGVRAFFENRKTGADGYGSAHYIIDQGGAVLRCIPEAEVAYHCGVAVMDDEHRDPASWKFYTDWARAQFGESHCQTAPSIGPNLVTLGIEMCVVDFAGNFTVQTSDAAAELAADICTRHHLNPFADVATHNMVCGYKDCPRLWVNHPELLGEFLANVASAIAKRG